MKNAARLSHTPSTITIVYKITRSFAHLITREEEMADNHNAKRKMKIKIVFLICMVFSAASYAAKIANSDTSLNQVASDFSQLIESLQKITNKSPRLKSKEIASKYEEVFVVGRKFLNYRGYKFSFKHKSKNNFTLRVFRIKRTYSIFDVFQCNSWFEYNSKKRYVKSKVIKYVGNWALIEDCGA
jgi:hypothetical protein